jgi:oxygen-independent coproporphyrinogen-3 oxidase
VGAAKRVLYEVARRHLTAAGYVEIGLDHFALPTDALARVAEEGRLHRNFMGYTDVATTIALGLGVSAISETPDCYHQNEKVITRYERRVTAGEIPTLRGHLLSGEDQRCRDRIAQVMTRFRVQLEQGEAADYADALQPLAADGLIRLDGDRLSVLPAGRPFLRNVASVFDAYLAPDPSGAPMYSTSA